MLAPQDKKEKGEVEARVKLLAELDEKYEDLGEFFAAHNCIHRDLQELSGFPALLVRTFPD